MTKRGIVLWVALTWTNPAWAVCHTADIELLQASYRPSGSGYVRMVGELKNNCSESTGVQLKAVWRDGKGEVVETEEFWPASIRDIAPGARYAFGGTFRIDTGRAKTMTLSVIEVRSFHR
jgi:hypothetical protein